MANIANPTFADEMNTFYTRLNTIRKNHSLPVLQNQFTKSKATQSSEMTALKKNLDSTATDSSYITNKSFDLGEIGLGKPTKYQTFVAVEQGLTYLSGFCVHDSSDNSSDYSHNRSDDSDYTHDGSDYSQNSSDYNDKSHDSSDYSAHDSHDCSYSGI